MLGAELVDGDALIDGLDDSLGAALIDGFAEMLGAALIDGTSDEGLGVLRDNKRTVSTCHINFWKYK